MSLRITKIIKCDGCGKEESWSNTTLFFKARQNLKIDKGWTTKTVSSKRMSVKIEDYCKECNDK